MSQTPLIPPPAPTSAPPAAAPRHRGWTAGRTTSLVVGCLLGLIALGLLAAAGFATWVTNTRDGGYVTSGTETVATAGHAVSSDHIELWTATGWATPSDVLGTIRIRASATDPTVPVFVGVAPSAAVDGYLSNVNRQVITDWTPFGSHYQQVGGAAPRSAPIDTRIWTAKVSGPGTQTLTWKPTGGDWTLVIMNANGGAPVSVNTDIGVTIPDLVWFAVALFVVGGLLLGASVPLIVVPINRARS